MHRGAHDKRAVRNQVDLDRWRDRLLETRDYRLDRVDQFDRVGTRLTLDCQTLCRRIEIPGADACVLHRIEAIANIVKAYRRAVAVSDDNLAIGLRVEELVVGIEGYELVRPDEIAFRSVDVSRRESIAHFLETNAASGERGRVDLNADR